MSAIESAEPMWPTPARMDCSRMMRRIPCANARTSLRFLPAAVPSIEGSALIFASLPGAGRIRSGRGRRRPGTVGEGRSTCEEVVAEPKWSRIGSSWANDPGGRRMNMVSVRTTVPSGNLSVAAATLLSAAVSTQPFG